MSRPLHARGPGWITGVCTSDCTDGADIGLNQMGQPGLGQAEGRDYCGLSLPGPGPSAVSDGHDPNLLELYTNLQLSLLRSLSGELSSW